MPLQPNFVERQLIRAGLIPGILLDVGMSTFQFWVLIGAMEIGLFEHLKAGAYDMASLSEKTGASERGIEMLVNALEPLGYLESKNGRYRLTKAAQRSLPIDDLRAMVPFFKEQAMGYADVARAIREAPEDGIYGWAHVQSGEVGRGARDGRVSLVHLTFLRDSSRKCESAGRQSGVVVG